MNEAGNPLAGNNPFGQFVVYEAFLNILRYFVDLNCFIIRSEPEKYWLALHYHQRTMSLYDFERRYRFAHDWSRLTDESYEAERAGRPLVVENFGFYDVFMPIRQKGKRLGTILSGAFADREVTYERLRQSWRALSGKEPSSDHEEFREFARVMLETPVLEGPVLAGYADALKCLAQVMVHKGGAGMRDRLRTLESGVFAPNLYHSYWIPWALGLPTQQSTPAWSPVVQKMEWVREQFGITRLPTTAITVVPARSTGVRYDPVEEMLRSYRLQRKSFAFARTLPQTSAGRIENYGAVFITSADPAKDRVGRRNEVLDTAERIRRFAEGVLGGPVVIGVGDSVAPGETLYPSYRQAVLALHLGRRSGRSVVPFGPTKKDRTEVVLDLLRLREGLRRGVEDVSFTCLGAPLDAYLDRVLTMAMNNPEEIRWHFLYALESFREPVLRRSGASRQDNAEVLDALVASMEKAGTTSEMVELFRNSLEKCLHLAQGRAAPNTALAMDGVRHWVEEHFREPLRISKLAKRAGVSASTLSRHFKQHTGTGLEAFLGELRLAESRRLLASGDLPVGKVAKECGFKSVSYFSRFFRAKAGMTPQAFRKKSRGL